MGTAIYITFMWGPHALKEEYCQEYSMEYIYSTSQMLKLSLTLHTFSVTGSVASLFLTLYWVNIWELNEVLVTEYLPYIHTLG